MVEWDRYLKEREDLIKKQNRVNNAMLQAPTKRDSDYWKERRTEIELKIFALDAHVLPHLM